MNEDSFQEILRIQQMMSQRLMQEQQVDRKIDVLNVVNELSENGRKPVQTEAIILEAGMQGISERDTTTLLDELEKDRLIRRPRRGYVEVR